MGIKQEGGEDIKTNLPLIYTQGCLCNESFSFFAFLLCVLLKPE